MMDDLGRFCCQNAACPEAGKRGQGNLSVTMRYGPEKSRRLLRCSTCKTRFSERKGTPLFAARLPTDRVVALLAHLAERSAPGRPLDSAGYTGTRCPATSARPGDQATTEVPFDEKWSFVAQKEKNRAEDEVTGGDCGDPTAIDPESRLVVSLVVGKRTAEAEPRMSRSRRS